MAASKTIGGINVTISATIDKFQRNMALARKSVGLFDSNLRKLGLSLNALGAGLTAGAAVRGFSNAARAIDNLSKSSERLNISTDKLAGWNLAAEEAGVSTELFERSLIRLATKTGQAADVAFLGFVDSVSRATTEQEKLSLVVEAFGPRGAKMFNLVKGGRATLDEATDAARKLGIAIGQDSAKGVERANDAINRLKIRSTAAFRGIVAAGAPLVEFFSVTLVNAITASINSFRALGSSFRDAERFLAPYTGVNQREQTFYKPGNQPGAGVFGRMFNRASGAASGAFGAGFGAFSGGVGALQQLGKENAAEIAARRALKGLADQFGPQKSVLGIMGRSFGGAMVGENAKQIAQAVASSLAQMPKAAMQGIGHLQWQAMMGGFGGGMRGSGMMGSAGGLAAQDPLSREGFSQRVRSLAQNDMQKLGKQQLQKQTLMEKHLAKLANGQPLAPLNLAGG